MTDFVKGIISKIQQRDYTVGIVGLGYVGLPLAETFLEAGFRVLGFDRDPKGVAQATQQLGTAMYKHGFIATDNPERLPEADCVLICVPTPLGANKQPDLTAVMMATRTVADLCAGSQPPCVLPS